MIDLFESFFTEGKTIYWSINGDDTNDGLSRQSPKQSWSGISEILENGDTVVILDEIFEDFEVANKYVKFKGGSSKASIYGRITLTGQSKCFFEHLVLGSPITVDNIAVILENVFAGGDKQLVSIWGIADWTSGFIGIGPEQEPVTIENYSAFVSEDAFQGSYRIVVKGNINEDPWTRIRRFTVANSMPMFKTYEIVNFETQAETTILTLKSPLISPITTDEKIYLNCVSIDTSLLNKMHLKGEPIYELGIHGKPQIDINAVSFFEPIVGFKNCTIYSDTFLGLTSPEYNLAVPAAVFNQCRILLSLPAIPLLLNDFDRNGLSALFSQCIFFVFPFSLMGLSYGNRYCALTKLGGVTRSTFIFLNYSSYLRNKSWLESYEISNEDIFKAKDAGKFAMFFRENLYVQVKKSEFFKDEFEIIEFDTVPNKHPRGDVFEYAKDEHPLSSPMEVHCFISKKEKIESQTMTPGVLIGDGETTEFEINVPTLISAPLESIEVWADLNGEGVLKKLNVIDVTEDWKTPYLVEQAENVSSPVTLGEAAFGEIFIFDGEQIHQFHRRPNEILYRCDFSFFRFPLIPYRSIEFPSVETLAGGNPIKVGDYYYYFLLNMSPEGAGLFKYTINCTTPSIGADLIAGFAGNKMKFSVGCPVFLKNGKVISGAIPNFTNHSIILFAHDVETGDLSFEELKLPGKYFWIPVMINEKELYCVRLIYPTDIFSAITGKLDIKTQTFIPLLHGPYTISQLENRYLALGYDIDLDAIVLRRSFNGESWNRKFIIWNKSSRNMFWICPAKEKAYLFIYTQDDLLGFEYTKERIAFPADEVKVDRNRMKFIFEAPPVEGTKIYYNIKPISGKLIIGLI
ncbi:MAG: hypothetical protein QW228_01060 [Candidatus Aenigmatarchaeota archaeon]